MSCKNGDIRYSNIYIYIHIIIYIYIHMSIFKDIMSSLAVQNGET